MNTLRNETLTRRKTFEITITENPIETKIEKTISIHWNICMCYMVKIIMLCILLYKNNITHCNQFYISCIRKVKSWTKNRYMLMLIQIRIACYNFRCLKDTNQMKQTAKAIHTIHIEKIQEKKICVCELCGFLDCHDAHVVN